MAELEVAPLAARFCRHQDARPVVGTKTSHFGVAPCRRQILVEDAARELRAGAEGVTEHLQRLAMRREDQGLFVRPSPALRLRQQPVESRIGSIHRLRLVAQLGLVGPEHGLQCRPGCECSADTFQRAPPANDRGEGRSRSRGAPASALTRAGVTAVGHLEPRAKAPRGRSLWACAVAGPRYRRGA